MYFFFLVGSLASILLNTFGLYGFLPLFGGITSSTSTSVQELQLWLRTRETNLRNFFLRRHKILGPPRRIVKTPKLISIMLVHLMEVEKESILTESVISTTNMDIKRWIVGNLRTNSRKKVILWYWRLIWLKLILLMCPSYLVVRYRSLDSYY